LSEVFGWAALTKVRAWTRSLVRGDVDRPTRNIDFFAATPAAVTQHGDGFVFSAPPPRLDRIFTAAEEVKPALLESLPADGFPASRAAKEASLWTRGGSGCAVLRAARRRRPGSGSA
jgi:hypothetical protein